MEKSLKKTILVRSLFNSPARVSILSFSAIIVLGTMLLMLPASSTVGKLNFVDAFFTAVSATCVTGLTVVDTGSTFSIFGQLVILLLIQIGGLGIMTLSTVFVLLAGRRPTLAGRLLIQDSFTHSGERGVSAILRDVVLFTAAFELFGTVVLFFRFLPENEVGYAVYSAFFHAVSAFCNAGFSLLSDSFVSYREDWILNVTLSFLIISGGIGFLVLSELKRHFPYNRRRWSRLSLHSKMVLSATFFLIVAGTVSIFFMEWHNTLAAFSIPERVMASFFQAVSARTAGFNTLAVGNLANETLFLFILLMFIGASPGSCGGGIKTTTFSSLVILGISRLRGRKSPQLFQRTISQASIGKAISVVLVSAFIIILGTFLILMTEIGEVSHIQSRGKFLELFFEVISAFGTVGLSTGLTPALTGIGKLIISMVMFTGRLGPLMIAIAVSRREIYRHYYAEENIMAG